MERERERERERLQRQTDRQTDRQRQRQRQRELMGTVDWWADTKPLTASVTAVVTQKLSLIQVCVACNSAEESCWLFHACHGRENFCRRHRFQQPRQFVLMQLNNVVTNHRAVIRPPRRHYLLGMHQRRAQSPRRTSIVGRKRCFMLMFIKCWCGAIRSAAACQAC